MATKSWYLTATTSGGWRTIDEATQAAANNSDGWIVSTGSTNHSEFFVGVERAASTFTGTTVPDGSLDTTNFDAFRSTNAITGNFANANWVFHFVVRGVTSAGNQAGRCRFRIFKADSNGANAVEITSGHQQASIVTITGTGTDFDSTLTVNPGAFSMVNQYLFLQIAWERTGAGGMTTNDVNWRTGSSSSAGTRITSSDFTAAYVLTADPGSFTFTGTAATLKWGRFKLTADAGSFTLTGTAALFWYGQIKNAIRFQGDHDGLYTTTIASHNPNEQTWLIFIRYRVTRVGSGVQMCAASMEATNGTAHYFLLPETTFNANTVEAHDSFNGGGFIVGTAALAAGEWWCVAETNTLSGTETALYTQKIGTGGAMLRETNNDHGNFTDFTTFIVGTDNAQPIANSPQNEWLDGDIAGIKLWDHALTATELESEKRSLTPVKSSGLKEWWKPSSSGNTLVPQLGNFGTLNEIAGTFGFPSGTNGRTFRTDGPPLAGTNSYSLTADAGSFAVTGTAATLKLGRKVTADAGSFTLTGSAATLRAAWKLTADPGSFALTGTAATLLEARKLVADAGAFTWAGVAAGLTWGHPLAADAGVFTLTGTAAGLYLGREVAADLGAFTLTGTAAGLRATRILGAEVGAYVWGGTAAGLSIGKKLVADAGAFVLTGTAAGTRFDRKLTADAGAFSVTGTAAQLERGYLVGATAGAFAWTGTDAGLIYDESGSFTLVAEPGAFSVTGTAAGLEFGRVLAAGAGGYTLTGSAASLEYSRQLGAGAGSFSVSGAAAGLELQRILGASGGAYALAGTAAGLFWGRELQAELGAFTLTGEVAQLRATRLLSAAPGSLVWTGTPADLFQLQSYTLNADPGAFTWTGQPTWQARAAAFRFDGRSAQLVWSRRPVRASQPGLGPTTSDPKGGTSVSLVAGSATLIDLEG